MVSIMVHFIVAIFSSASILFGLLFVLFFWSNKRTTYCKHKPDLRGRIAIVTGANVGIGKETARGLAERGARVILACRSVEKGEAAAEDIRASVAGADVIVKQIELSSLESVKRFADDIRSTETSVDILINNAGVLGPRIPYTEDGFEMMFASNHLGHYLLTRLLLDLVEKSEMKRIVVVSSVAYKWGVLEFDADGEIRHSTDPFRQYGNTKLMNCLFAQELSRRVRAKGFAIFSAHPGGVKTQMTRGMEYKGIYAILIPLIWLTWPAMKTPSEGCQTTLYCAMAPDIEHLSGSYFVKCKPEKLRPKACDPYMAKRLWQYSEVKVKDFLPSTDQ